MRAISTVILASVLLVAPPAQAAGSAHRAPTAQVIAKRRDRVRVAVTLRVPAGAAAVTLRAQDMSGLETFESTQTIRTRGQRMVTARVWMDRRTARDQRRLRITQDWSDHRGAPVAYQETPAHTGRIDVIVVAERPRSSEGVIDAIWRAASGWLARPAAR